MTEEHKNRIYEGVRRMVIWDEPCSDVFYRMEVNGIPLEEAQQMYNKARAERLSAIRSDALKQTALGLALLLVAFGVFMGYFMGFGIITQSILILCSTASVFGIWFFSKGLYYLLFAHNRTGSLADHD